MSNNATHKGFQLDSDVGPVAYLSNNPRSISTDAMKKLKASIKRDPEFMILRPIVVGEDGQVLGGNQRLRACVEMGMKRLPSGWAVKAEGLSDEQRRRFVLIDNAPSGMAGEWDTEALSAGFGDLDLSSLGFTLVDTAVKMNAEEPTGIDLSEKNPKLAAFIAAREKSRERGKDKGEVNFWLCVVFQSWKQKQEFLALCEGMPTRYGMYVDGEAFAAAVGKPVVLSEQKPVNVPIDKTLSGMVNP